MNKIQQWPKEGSCRRKRLLLRNSDLVLLGNLRCTRQARFGGGRKVLRTGEDN